MTRQTRARTATKKALEQTPVAMSLAVPAVSVPVLGMFHLSTFDSLLQLTMTPHIGMY